MILGLTQQFENNIRAIGLTKKHLVFKLKAMINGIAIALSRAQVQDIYF